MSAERDYQLGTHDEELQRLGLQHGLWQPTVARGWQAAGFRPGWRIADIGCGPGFATVELSRLVGPKGHVAALERSQRYLESARHRCESAGCANVSFHSVDLISEPCPVEGYDAAWCRWVAMWVADPARLVANIRAAVRDGGVLVMHEYTHYRSFRLSPSSPEIEQFVEQVEAALRSTGGDPDVGRRMPGLLNAAGFEVTALEPLVFSARPSDPLWQWPASYIRTYAPRLLEMGCIDRSFLARLLAALTRAEGDPDSVIVTPMNLQIIARAR